MPRILNLETFSWTHPDMSVPLDVSIGFDYLWGHDRKSGQDYEKIEPYVEAIYLGNVDVMPLMCMGDIAQALKDYKESKR